MTPHERVACAPVLDPIFHHVFLADPKDMSALEVLRWSALQLSMSLESVGFGSMNELEETWKVLDDATSVIGGFVVANLTFLDDNLIISIDFQRFRGDWRIDDL